MLGLTLNSYQSIQDLWGYGYSLGGWAWWTVLHESSFLHISQRARPLLLFCIIYSSMFAWWTALENRDGLSRQSKRQAYLLSSIIKVSRWGKCQAGLLPIIKDWCYLSSVFTPYNAMHCVCSYYLPLVCIVLWEIQAERTSTRNADALSNKCSFASDPGILCLLPTSLKLVRLTYSLVSGVQFQTLNCSWKLCIFPSRNTDCVLVIVAFLWISDDRSIFFALTHWWAYNIDQRLANCCLPSRPNLG